MYSILEISDLFGHVWRNLMPNEINYWKEKIILIQQDPNYMAESESEMIYFPNYKYIIRYKSIMTR